MASSLGWPATEAPTVLLLARRPASSSPSPESDSYPRAPSSVAELAREGAGEPVETRPWSFCYVCVVVRGGLSRWMDGLII